MMEYIIDDDFLDPATIASADATGNLHELVRCKNCENWIPGRIDLDNRCKRNLGIWAGDDFCGHAERKVDQG